VRQFGLAKFRTQNKEGAEKIAWGRENFGRILGRFAKKGLNFYLD
jgi:hypothetical protein